jgi:phosphomannomutase
LLDTDSHAFNPKILREYDIRGTVGKTLSDQDAHLLGIRFGQMMHEQALKTVSVGRDGRLSSPGLAEALIKGLIQTGIDVKDIGVGPTPMLYFSVKHLKMDAGIMVTGSHNPPEDNGFKMTLYERSFFGQDIQNLAHEKLFNPSSSGSYEKVSVKSDYINRLLKDYKPGRRLKVAWDPGNGAAGEIIQRLIDSGKLEADSMAINTIIDGHFPAHHPDPTIPENLQQLIQTVKSNDCDLGIAFDGDADRIGVVDSQGRILWGDQLMILWSRDILSRHPGATIIADVKASQILFDDIEMNKGKPVMARTGHSLIKTKIAEIGALLAGEMSGHIFFSDQYYGFDDAIYAAIRLLNILHHSQQSLDEMLDSLPICFNTPEIRIDCEDEKKFSIVSSIQSQLRQEGVNFSDVDGVRVQTEEGWWLLRASNTQAILVARCEAKTSEALEGLKTQLQSYLTPFQLTLPNL